MKLQDFLKPDMEKMLHISVDWEQLKGKTVLVTGATGLLGAMVCRTLYFLNKTEEWNIRILAMARNGAKAVQYLEEILQDNCLEIVEQDITEPIRIEGDVDYIIHTASPTASSVFVSKPVETVKAIVSGTDNILAFAKEKKSKSVLYLSSMEVYGQILHEDILKPEDVGYMNPLNLRSCYPEGKRMAENLCMGYFSEYKVPVKIVRLAQTFGPGIQAEDKRVFVQFLSSAVNNKDIVMFTDGGSKRMYLDTMDAVSACLTILLSGTAGEIYNAANPETYCSIREMAEMVLMKIGDGKNQLIIDKSKNIGQYPPDNMLRLDVSSLKMLGWKPQYNLTDMYRRMKETMYGGR